MMRLATRKRMDQLGITVFFSACMFGHEGVVREVMATGYDIEETVDQESALFVITQAQKAGVVQALLA